MIEVVDYDPSWPDWFVAERDRLWSAVRDWGADAEVMAIEHVGSTAVPGLAAKPVLDILIGLHRWPASDAFIAALEDLGYVHHGESWIVGRHYLQDAPAGAPRTRQVHAVEYGSRFWVEHLRFRDRLRTDAGDRADYLQLKRRLAREHRYSAADYTDGKRELVERVLTAARTDAGEGAVHVAAAKGFGADADRYERSRPGYPPGAIEWLADCLSLGPGSRVADLGAGTGKLSRPLRDAGMRVVAIEPVPTMREHLAARLPEVEVCPGTAEELSFERGSLDAVVAGQAFHWFDPAATLSEAYRALGDGGGVGLLWNERGDSVAWMARWTQLVDAVRPAAPNQRDRSWRDVADATELFAGPQSRTFANPHTIPRETVVERVASTSVVAALDDTERHALLDALRDVLDTDPSTCGRDEITVPYHTRVHVLRRIS